MFFKRSRMDIIIMKKESDPNTKYELFQRLNTGGSLLSDQEVRNCLMIMTNKAFYEFVMELNRDANFQSCLPITDRKADEQYRVELLLRLLITQSVDWNSINNYSDFSELLDKETICLCRADLDTDDIRKRFVSTFQLLYGVLGEDSFKKYSGQKRLGPVMAAVFQIIATGVFKNINDIISLPNRDEWLLEKANSIFETDEYKRNTTPGIKSIPRYKELSLFSMEYFKV